MTREHSSDPGGRPDEPGDDATIRINRPGLRRAPGPTHIPPGLGIPPVVRGIALGAVIAIGVIGWFMMRGPAEPPGPPPPVATAPPRFAVRTADEAVILAHVAEQLTVFRFAANPRILVLDFPTLLEQGRMLNRVAALVEKIGLSRDRVLNDAELDVAIAEAGDTMETYYFGHDYAVADLARFFALAQRDDISLRDEERALRDLLAHEGMLAPGAIGALISIPRIGSGEGIDAALRATILRHELSHGAFFSEPGYAAYAKQFWAKGLDDAGRAAFRAYLAGQHYDLTLPDLVVNEMQAYLMHTPDGRLFSAEHLGVPRERLAQWQAAFLLGMPPGWLRDCTVVRKAD